MGKEGDGRLHLKRVECLQKDERDSVKVKFFFWKEAVVFLTLNFF